MLSGRPKMDTISSINLSTYNPNLNQLYSKEIEFEIVSSAGDDLEAVSPVLVATVGSSPAVLVLLRHRRRESSVQEHVSNFSPDWSPCKEIQEAVNSSDDSGIEGQADGSDKKKRNSLSFNRVFFFVNATKGIGTIHMSVFVSKSQQTLAFDQIKLLAL
ncbi:hypothetical protein L6452_36928 [Arctium lappa]|uniref:Uncharacterized protein n=1 Tax=Arctium lappa TaxID=4217 RepID=A0ACB8Y2A3_ARCLA|nr:hypothetical protein L6452_36928 [Arctium lappa]